LATPKSDGNAITVGGDWDLPLPFVVSGAVSAPDIDAYDHVNNAVYINWLDRAAWLHSAAPELPMEKNI
jgi:acyl-CoA thioester hydrolase